MKKNHLILALLALSLLVLGALFATGQFTGKATEVTRPGCEWMSTEEQVDTALEKYGDLTQEIENLGQGISLKKTLACEGEKALITITYTDKADFQKISEVLDGERYEASIEVIHQ